MDEFSYLSVLISVILGLAVTQILKGFRGIFALADADSHLLASDRLGGLAAAGLRPELVGDVRVAPLSTMDVCRICGRFAANDPDLHAGRIGFPDLFGEGIVDLRESFYAHRVWFFALGFFVILVSICKVAVLYGELPHPTDLAFHAFFGTSLLIGALTRRESCHKALVALGMASFILYIVIVFARLH
jgi:hypothetical protein